MSWNYRVMVREEGYMNEVGVHEVYYHKDGTVKSWTDNPIRLSSIMEDESSTSIQEVFEMVSEAMKKPHLSHETGKEMP